MSDLDEQLTAALGEGALRAPDAMGLARAARRRSAERRRRRVVAAGVGLILAAAAPSVVVHLAGREGGGGVSDRTPAGWQTIEHEGTLVEIPSGWSAASCGTESSSAAYFAEHGSCETPGFLSIYPAEEGEDPGEVISDSEDGQKVWIGYVEAGDWGIGMFSTDRAVLLQALASFRLQGQPQVVADSWREQTIDGVTFTAPVGWGVRDDEGYGVTVDTVSSKGERLQGPEAVDAAHYRLVGQLPEQIVTITAPTAAVAQLVWASVESSRPAPDAAAELPCDPGMGDPSNEDNCPYGYSTGWLSLSSGGDVIFKGVGGSPYVLDLSRIDVCSGVIHVGYREPLDDHQVHCAEFRDALKHQPDWRIPVVVWHDDDGSVVQLSELYRP